MIAYIDRQQACAASTSLVAVLGMSVDGDVKHRPHGEVQSRP